jgi:dipeptidyl-peptidase-4
VTPAAADDLAYPKQVARTRSFTAGDPRDLVVSPDGRRVVFLRSRAGDDPLNCLWVLDVATGEELVVYDPRTFGSQEAEVTEAERARRERARERASGVVAYATDRDVTRAVFVDGGVLRVVDLLTGRVEDQQTPGVPDDPRLDPDGRRMAYVVDGNLHVQHVGGIGRVLAADDAADVRWGLPEFVAAEEMGRSRAFWWSPDGRHIAACRVDERPVRVWWISDPTSPDAAPRAMRYPRAGTANAVVTLHVFEVESGDRIDVTWDEDDRFEYLARAVWSPNAPLMLLVQSRDQRRTRIVEVDEVSGATRVIREDVDPSWVELVDGSPRRLDDGRLVSTVDLDGIRRVAVDGVPVSPVGLQVRALVDASDGIVFVGSEDPIEEHVWLVTSGADARRISAEPGVHTASAKADTVALKSWPADAQHPRVMVIRAGQTVATISSRAEEPVVDPHPDYAEVGARGLRVALLLPAGADPDSEVPVLVSPYGGPHLQRVLRWRGGFRTEQFFADRLDAAVLVIDGRGTPGRGTAWERAVAGDFTITLEDQVDGLVAAAERWPFLDLSRVAIRGWSFGGLLSALAVIDRPDVFHAAVVGAPVTDQRLYDTHYTERYLGMPDVDVENYRRSSPLERADRLTRPMLLIHGLADDNVVAAHTLRMSAALFREGIHHELVLLPNASHMGGSDELIVGRFQAELDFLRRSLGLDRSRAAAAERS